MKAFVLGSSSAIPDPLRGNTSYAIEIGAEMILFDCGERTTVNLIKSGINPMEVNYLLFTHLHNDHMCDYGNFVISTWKCGRRELLKVFGPEGTKEMSEATINQTHKVDLYHMKVYLEKYLPPHVTNRPEPTPLVEAEDIGEGEVHISDRFRLSSRFVEHYNRWGIPSLGYRVDCDEGSIAISGDTSPCKATIELAKNVDVLFHECAFLDEIIQGREMKSHSGPSGAGKVAQEAGAKKLVLTHLPPYTGYPKSLDMASMYLEGWNGEQVWSKVVREVAKYYDGPIILGSDALPVTVRDSSK
jgi:ribonuclease Z